MTEISNGVDKFTTGVKTLYIEANVDGNTDQGSKVDDRSKTIKIPLQFYTVLRCK